MKNKNLVRVAYVEETDSYCLLLSTDGGEDWGLCLSCPLHRSDTQDLQGEPMYVHFQLIEELNRFVLNGFKFVY